MGKILIFAQDIGEALTEVAYQLDKTASVYALGHVDKLVDYCFDLDVEVPLYDVSNQTKVLAFLQEKYQFETILFPESYHGSLIAGRLATLLQTGLTADVTEIRDKKLVRPAFDGKMLAVIANTAGASPLMATIRKGSFRTKVKRAKETKLIKEDIRQVLAPAKIKQIGEVDKTHKPKDIRNSPFIVGAGGGTIDFFEQVRQLAKQVNADIGVSRKIVDSGLETRNNQVGQSGKIVSPALYLALGIHGSLQHLEGLKAVKEIIAVNTDKYAPLSMMADIFVEGDAQAFSIQLLKYIDEQS